MKLTLVDNILLDMDGAISRDSLMPHLGLISLAAVAEREGVRTTIVDPKVELLRGTLDWGASAYKQIARMILDGDPDVVGLTSFGCNFICAVKVARHIRFENPKVFILLGGPHATILHQDLLRECPEFDVIIRGEAERLFPLAISACRTRHFIDVPGVTYREGNRVVANAGDGMIEDLDLLPRPAYEKYPIDDLGLKAIRVEAGRGCPFHCTFCSTAPFFGRRYRLKSTRRLVEEITWLRDRYKITHFSLTHDLFTVNRKKVLEFCDGILDRSVTWSCSARMDCVDDALLSKMAQSGCTGIYYGVEVGSRRLQEKIRKRLDLDLYRPRLEKSVSVGMKTTVSFITGFPEEELADQAETLDLLGDALCHPDSNMIIRQLHLLAPEPGTDLLQQYGDQLRFDGHISDQNIPCLEMDDSTIMSEKPHLFMTHFHFPSIIDRERLIFTTSAMRTFNKIGGDLAAHALELLGCQRFSVLIADLWNWQSVDAQNWSSADTDEITVQFFGEALGQGHYLLSLIKYMLIIHALREREAIIAYDAFRNVTRAGDHWQAYQVSRNVSLLRDCHNCSALLDWLQHRSLGARPTPLLVDRRADYVVRYVRDIDRAIVYEVSSDAAKLVELCGTPTSVGALVDVLELEEQDVSTLEDFLNSLEAQGVIFRYQEAESLASRSLSQS